MIFKNESTSKKKKIEKTHSLYLNIGGGGLSPRHKINEEKGEKKEKKKRSKEEEGEFLSVKGLC